MVNGRLSGGSVTLRPRAWGLGFGAWVWVWGGNGERRPGARAGAVGCGLWAVGCGLWAGGAVDCGLGTRARAGGGWGLGLGVEAVTLRPPLRTGAGPCAFLFSTS